MLLGVGFPQLTWYVTRSTGMIAFLLISAAVVLGVLGAERFETVNRPRFHYAELHRGVALFGGVLLLVHIVTAVIDPFTHLGLTSIFDPFGRSYRALYLGLGIVAFDVLAAVIVSSLIRQRLTPKSWRYIHLSVYPIWVAAIVHGLGTGTDSRFLVVQVMYLVALAGVVLATWIRVLSGSLRATPIRMGAGFLALVLPGILVAWSLSGPTKASWAKSFVKSSPSSASLSPPPPSSSSSTVATRAESQESEGDN